MDIVTYNAPATTDPHSAQFHVNLLIHGNISTGYAGTLDGSIVTWGAGHIPSFVHCTVADNTGALLTGGLQAVESNPIIVNSIFWGNHIDLVDEISYDAWSNPSVWYSTIEDGWSGTGDQNLVEDPDFFVPGSDYHLRAGSPCIDTALNLPAVPGYGWTADYVNHDLDQQSRPVGAGYDMGCYERQ